MSSKSEAANGGGKGASFYNPKSNRYHKRRRGCYRKNLPMPSRPTILNFASLTEDLKVSIYNIGTGYQENQFITNTKSIASYADRICTNPQYIRIDIYKL